MLKPLNYKNVLIISHDKIGTSMAGPGIRYHFMAQVLSRYFNVTVGFFDPTYLPNSDFKKDYSVTHIHAPSFQKKFKGFDAVITLWLSDEMIDYCNRNSIFIVFDMYAPVPVENLALSIFNSSVARTDDEFAYSQSISMYDSFFRSGDLFLFSNRRQLDYWTGFVFGTHQVGIKSYLERPFFDRFIYAPMGIDAKTPLEHSKKVIRHRMDGITEKDKIILWTGGIWNWFDAQTLIKAMRLLSHDRPDIKLVFFGTKHPNPGVPKMKEASDTIKLAEKFGLLNKTVFIKDGWVDYEARIDYLIEADIAASTCKASIEAEFSHRTRVLDHILAGLPTVSSIGDYMTDDVINVKGLGISVQPADENALAKAIVDILKPERYSEIKSNIMEVRESFDWNNTMSELVNTLRTNPEKLTRIPREKPARQLPVNGGVKLLRRYLPKTAKRWLIRVLKYGQ